MTRTLIRGGWVLTMGRTNFTEADVLIEGETVAEVGPGLRARGAEEVDATVSIVMPGFVDTHRHASDSLLRNMGEPPPDAALGSAAYGPDDLYAATLVGLLAAADAGITTVVDWCESADTSSHLEAVQRAHADSGLRTVLVLAMPSAGRSGWEDALRRAAGAAAGRTGVAAGVSLAAAGDLESAAAAVGAAKTLGLRTHLHLRSSTAAGLVADLAGRGLLGADVTVIHGSHLGEPALDVIAARGASVVLAPASEMAAGLGAPPMQELIDRDIRPGLGVGSERLAPGDAFAQMRAAISVQHATRFDLKLAGKAGLPKLMTTRDVIRHATVDGAAAVGLEATIGSIEPGKQADITVLRADRPNIFPINDPIGAVVWGMDTSNVDWVFVAGDVLKRQGSLTADVERARRLAVEARDRVGGGADLLAASSGGEA